MPIQGFSWQHHEFSNSHLILPEKLIYFLIDHFLKKDATSIAIKIA